jgi:PAS domain S-box-containing protein
MRDDSLTETPASGNGAALAILESAAEPVWAINPDKKLILFNRAFASVLFRLYGVTPAIGVALKTLVPADEFPQEYLYWSDIFTRAIGGSIDSHEFTYVSGKAIQYYSISCYPLKNEGFEGIAFFARDVTLLRRAEERSYEISAFSEKIFEASPVGIMSFDETHACFSANSAAIKLLGLPASGFSGRAWDLVPGWADQGLSEAAEGVLRGGHEARRIIYTKISGRSAWLDFRFISFMQAERKHLLVLINDITESRQIEEDTIMIMHDLKQSNDELERFAYVASHDLQEPLRVIASYLQLIERRYSDKVDDKGRDFIARTVGAAKRMQGMIEDLLGYSRVVTRGGVFEPVSLDEALSDALKNLAVAVKKSKAELRISPLPEVMADKTQMVRLFQNLIGNAIKFCKKDRPLVQITCEEGPEKYCVSVRDNGIGIQEEFHKRIFQVFQRLHSSSEYSGSGIGLAVCHRIVERHGGSISVESAEGEGSVFRFTLPKELKKNGRP